MQDDKNTLVRDLLFASSGLMSNKFPLKTANDKSVRLTHDIVHELKFPEITLCTDKLVKEARSPQHEISLLKDKLLICLYLCCSADHVLSLLFNMVLSVVVPSVIKLLVPLGMSHGSHLIPFAQNDTTEVYNLALDQLNITTTTDEVERARECHARLTYSELKKSTPTSVEVEMLNCGQFSDFLTLPVEPVAETQTFSTIRSPSL